MNNKHICGCCNNLIHNRKKELMKHRNVVSENKYPDNRKVSEYWTYVQPTNRPNYLEGNEFEDSIMWGTYWSNLPDKILKYTINQGNATELVDSIYGGSYIFKDDVPSSVRDSVHIMMSDLSKIMGLQVEYVEQNVSSCFISINFLDGDNDIDNIYDFKGIAMPPVNENDYFYQIESAFKSLTDSFYASGNAYLNYKSADVTSYQKGGYWYAVMLHELGHALGLSHPHDTGGDSSIMAGVENSGDFGDYNANQQPISVMSYNDVTSQLLQNTIDQEVSGFMGTFGPLDIAVLQKMYGNSSNSSGDTTYIFPNSETDKFWTCINDTDGINTIDASQSTSETIINIENSTLENQTEYASVKFSYNSFGGFTISKNSTKIKNVIGSSQNDNITGNELDNDITLPLGGNDTVDGKGGFDTAYFNNLSYSEITYSLNSNSGVVTIKHNSTSEIVNLVNVEKIVFSDKEILLSGNIVEIGTVEVDHIPKTITLKNKFANPVVCCSDPTFKGHQPCVVRIKNITKNSFEIFLQEPDNLDGYHLKEKVSYIVGEKGTWVIHNTDKQVVFDCYESNITKKNGFKPISFNNQFVNKPVIISQVASYNDSDYVLTRTKNITKNSFECSMQESEGLDNLHASERIDWCAFSQGKHTFNGKKFQCGSIQNVNQNESTFTLAPNYFSKQPKLLTKCSSYNGRDTVNTRNSEPESIYKFSIRLQEETTKDPETYHVNETVDFIAIED